jgi:cyanophycinase
MIDRMIVETGIQDSDYAVVLTMSGFDPDTSAFYGERQFRDAGVSNIRSYDFERRQSFSQAASDSLRNASLIYITGGSQSRFMDSITQTPAIAEALKNAYQDGAMISGTSAGAAVMSKIMITGDQNNYPDYTSTYYNLEKNNMITAEGLGLITNVIIDQHFVKRARNNRLLTAIMEYPNHTGIGIDESTAILVKEGKAEVIGDSQVLVYNNTGQVTSTYEKKIGGKNLRLDIYLPGETFVL